MSLYQVNKLLRDVNCSAELAQRCTAEPTCCCNGTTSRKRSETQLRLAVRKLYEMGANPLLLLTYSMATGKDMRAYAIAMNEKSS